MRKLIIPIVSMRSHETNRYSLLKDGNLQLHIARARYGDIIMVPRNSVDLEELMDRFQHIQFVPLQDWPLNAYETRKRFWQMHDIEEKIRGKKISHIVTDITNCPVESVPVIYNFNITADPKNPRPYIDEFLESDVESANKSLRTFVLNDIQKENLVKAGVDENKIVVSQKVLSPSMYFQYFSEALSKFDGVFHPFRISDKCYKFDEVIKHVAGTHLGITITDPNDSYIGSEYESLAQSLNVPVTIKKLSKDEYYKTLAKRPLIYYFENPNEVFHPGLAELLYFGCRIKCPHQLPNVDDLIVKGDVWLS